MNKLNSNFKLEKYGLEVRFVEEKDAQFILGLRTDSRLGRYISETSLDVLQQVEWIRNYKLREERGKEYYFIYSYEGESVGVNRIYNIDDMKREAVGGSFVFKKGCLIELPILATLIQFDIAFNMLGIDCMLGDIRKRNRKVVKFHKILKVDFTGSDDLNFYSEYGRNVFNDVKTKLELILLPINEK